MSDASKEDPGAGHRPGDVPGTGNPQRPHGTRDIPNSPPACPPAMPTRPGQRRRLDATRRSGALSAELFPCKSTLIWSYFLFTSNKVL